VVSASVPFQIPRDGLTYIEEIVARCADLIDQHIWEGLHVARLQTWMANFSSDEEKYFAACVLDSLIYRSEPQTIALIAQMLQRTLPDLVRLDPTPLGAIDDWKDRLGRGHGAEPGIRLVPVAKRTDPPTKSANHIARLMKRYFSIDESLIIHASDIPLHAAQGAEVFIFIDDFLGTGLQFEEFYTAERLNTALATKYTACVPLVAHQSGIRHLGSLYPNLRVRTVEPLDESHSLFSDQANCFKDEVNTPNGAKQYYYELLQRKGLNISGPDRRGFGHLELAYAFSHAVPDNSLPILWWGETPGWSPLFDR